MTTQLMRALAGAVTPEMQAVAAAEGIEPLTVMQEVAAGRIVIPANRLRAAARWQTCGIGKGLRTKVSASVGSSPGPSGLLQGAEKVRTALQAGADLVMEMGTEGDLEGVRREMLTSAPVPVGTIPLYQMAALGRQEPGAELRMPAEELLGLFEQHAAAGADLMVVHAATTRETLQRAKQRRRTQDMVSLGGTLILGWMLHHQRENPLYEFYDRILEIACEYDVTLALADSWRPGCAADSLDLAQVQEIVLMGELVDRARRAGVQVLVKGPGLVPLNQIKATVTLNKKLCGEAPLFVFGPMATGLAPGHDHIAGAIGAAAAAAAGADFICPVTPVEQIGAPDAADVRAAVVAARIAAHAGDLVKGVKGARQWDREMSEARRALNWRDQFRLALDPEEARNGWRTRNTGDGCQADREPGAPVTCSMCGPYCPMALVGEYLEQCGERVG